MSIVRYIWPIWIGVVLQFSFNGVAAFFLGANGRFADWIFGRHCDWGWCDGPIFVVSMWGCVAISFIVNAIYQWRLT